jgi:hypothetical protein
LLWWLSDCRSDHRSPSCAHICSPATSAWSLARFARS